jgi:hypothetical protein
MQYNTSRQCKIADNAVAGSTVTGSTALSDNANKTSEKHSAYSANNVVQAA